MSKWYNLVEKVLKERGLSLKKLTNNLDIDSPICTCFITAYLNDKDEEVNIQNNDKLESNIVALGYGYKRIYGGYVYSDGEFRREPGFLVSCKRSYVTPEDFKDEMLALGNKYEQDSILLKLPGEKPAYYNTKGSKINQKDIDFNDDKIVNPEKHISIYPNDKDAWNIGYTQLKKDAIKGKNQAIELTNKKESVFETLLLDDNDINELKENSRESSFNSGSGILRLAQCRNMLGLKPYSWYKK